MIKKILIILFSFSCSFCCRAEIIDNLDTTTYLTAALNSSVTANGNSTVSMKKTATGDSVVNWRSSSSYYVRIRNYNDRVEITPSSSISSGQYSIWILYFNSSKAFLGEFLWASARSDTSTQVLKSVESFAVQNGVTNAEYYWIRIRLYGDVGSGFVFDKIHVKEGPGYWKSTALTQAAPKTVFVHEMTPFKTPEYSGYWDGWNYGYTKDNVDYYHYPWVLDVNGKPDIASVYYPSVGCYDMKDPCLVEYHCQIMKMSGIGGVIFDLGFYDMDSDTVNMIGKYLNIMAQYDLKAAICFEDKVHWKWDPSATTRATALTRTYDDMNKWLSLFKNSGVQFYVTGSRPLFLMFSYEYNDPNDNPDKGISCLSPNEITTWLNTFLSENKPVILRQWFKDPDHIGKLNGQFDWPGINSDVPAQYSPPYIGYTDMADNNDIMYNDRDFGQYLFDNNYADFFMSGVWPGFNDIEVWGWNVGPHLIPRFDGALYDSTWDWAIDNNLPLVQVATWNDWFEGTIIEPSVEFGNLYIEKTFTNIAKFKNISYSTIPDFNVPIWIYKIRDISDNAQVLADMQTASEFIKAGQYGQAEEIVSFWANFFNIDSVTYWTGEGSLAAYKPGDYSHDGKVNFKDFVLIGLEWQEDYSERDLATIASNWLCE
jgi:hypothetical protein